MILKVCFIGIGMLLLLFDFFTYARQKLTNGIGLGWAVLALLLLLVGTLIQTDAPKQQMAGLAVLVLTALLLFLFQISMVLSALVVKNQELAMQVSLLNQENERILYELKKMGSEKKENEKKENIVCD